MYNKAKRSLSVISAILGLVFAIGAVVAVAMGVMGLLDKQEKTFYILDSVKLFLKDLTIESNVVKWLILVAVFVLDYFFVMIIFALLKKPVFINGKYKSRGWKKFFFILLVLVMAVVIVCQFFPQFFDKDFKACQEKIEIKNLLIPIIVLGVALVTVILQVISMFMRSVKKNEEIVVVEKSDEEIAKENALIAPIQTVNHVAVFKAIPTDPVSDGLEQRLREIKHLREAGLINDAQTKGAVERVLYGFSKK